VVKYSYRSKKDMKTAYEVYQEEVKKMKYFISYLDWVREQKSLGVVFENTKHTLYVKEKK
jgi:hypothetical protein